jgi:hypothetical protein
MQIKNLDMAARPAFAGVFTWHYRWARAARRHAVPQARSAPELLYAVCPATQHDFPGHKECAARVPAIISALEAGGLLAASRPGQVRATGGRFGIPWNSRPARSTQSLSPSCVGG